MPKSGLKLGLALSGSGTRSAFYVGFLEGLVAAGLAPDFIAACSGATIPAAAYACGTLPLLGRYAEQFNVRALRRLLKDADHGGLYSLDLMEDEVRRFTKDLRFEDVSVRMVFVACDIETGEPVLLQMGDIARAARASCAVPGLFEPTQWGSRTLVDGGLVSVVPTDVVREAGADVVVGVDMLATRQVFYGGLKSFRKTQNWFTRFLALDRLGTVLARALPNGTLEERFVQHHGVFTILGKSLDIALERAGSTEVAPGADLVVTPPVQKVNRLEDLENAHALREYGRDEAARAVPKIQKIIDERTANDRG